MHFLPDNFYFTVYKVLSSKCRVGENKMVKEQEDMEYISLHGHIRNTAQTQKGMQNPS